MPRFSFTVEGTAAAKQTWAVEGHVETLAEGIFSEAVQEALKQSFQQLTGGKAVYGKPGVGCKGPYTITKLLVERQ